MRHCIAWEAGGSWESCEGAFGRKTSLLPVLNGASVGAEEEAGEFGCKSLSPRSVLKEGKHTELWQGLAVPPLPEPLSPSKISQEDQELVLSAILAVPPSKSTFPVPASPSSTQSSMCTPVNMLSYTDNVLSWASLLSPLSPRAVSVSQLHCPRPGQVVDCKRLSCPTSATVIIEDKAVGGVVGGGTSPE